MIKMTNRTRKFNGKIYKNPIYFVTKAWTDDKVKQIRSAGYFTRVVKVSDGYEIWRRKK